MQQHPISLRTRGFSLVEVLIAVAILGVGLIAMTTLHKSTVDGSTYAKQSTVAVEIAQAKASELGPKLSKGTTGNDDYIDPATAMKYTRSWTVSEASDGTTRIEIKVDWEGAAAPISLTTVAKNYTPDQAYRPISAPNKFTSASSSSCESFMDKDDDDDSPSGDGDGDGNNDNDGDGKTDHDDEDRDNDGKTNCANTSNASGEHEEDDNND